tara:strand:- start:115 stop:570 length:456 start_codon:yes stop_codon:yes gene_type:complete
MKYIYRNITTTVEQILIRRSDIYGNNNVTIHKCQIANVDSTDAVVDVYLETYNIDKTVKLHGRNDDSNYNIDADDYATKADQKIYYHIKSVTIPVGSTLSLFTDHPCTHRNMYNFVIKTTQNVDVLLDYEGGRNLNERNLSTSQQGITTGY